MDLDVGHFSASDRYKYLREKAFEQAFVLDRLGVVPRPMQPATDGKEEVQEEEKAKL